MFNRLKRIFGFGDPTSPTAPFTDASGFQCRMFETSSDNMGNVFCDPCKVGFDINGMAADPGACMHAAMPQTVTAAVPPSPTSPFTDTTGFTCRLFETMKDQTGQLFCDPCKVGVDMYGMPLDPNTCGVTVQPAVPSPMPVAPPAGMQPAVTTPALVAVEAPWSPGKRWLIGLSLGAAVLSTIALSVAAHRRAA
jgi:hypothetical protein